MPKYHMSVTLDCPDSEGLEYVEQFQDLIMGWRWVTEWRIGAGLPNRREATFDRAMTPSPTAPAPLGTIQASDPTLAWLEPDYRP